MNKKQNNLIKYKRKTLIIISIIALILIIGVFTLAINIKRQTKAEKEQEVIKEEASQNKDVLESKEDNSNKLKLNNYMQKAEEKLKELTEDEVIAQLFLVGTHTTSDFEKLKEKQFGGYLFFADFFKDKTEKQIQNEINKFNEVSKVPLLIAVDEEGGNVVRVSSNKKLINEPFKYSSEIYQNGGFEEIWQDTINKSKFLSNLGINLNLAPVVDICEKETDYMYKRSLKQGKEITATFAKTVISASKESNVSYALKHFPGYGNNVDTHKTTSTDERSYEDIYNNDLEPFRVGIEEGAEAILISHNIVTSIDPENPASLSPKIHKLLRENLKFEGIIITDAMNMGAIVNEYTLEEAIINAISSGNDIIIVTINKASKENYDDIIKAVKTGISNGKITKEDIYKKAKNIIAWKYYKGML
ncbi:MAG: hypothetical protein HFJ42_04850 [Clostridia bacterium]|nr:hypothetical protein [Clostridia bacterium]